MSEIITMENAPTIFKKYGGIGPTAVEDVQSGVKLGIYGPGGIGKTTLAATVCDSDLGWPAMYLDSRGNPEVVRSYGDKIQVYPIKKFSDVTAIRRDLVNDRNCPFKSIIIDNVSDIWAVDLRDRYGSGVEITWQMHSGSTADILGLYRDYCDLATIEYLRLNVIFVMWDTPEQRTIRGEVVERSEMAFNKALQSQVGGIITWLGRLYTLEVGNQKDVRVLDFRLLEKLHQAKHQVDPRDEFASQVPKEIYNPSLASIINTVKGRQAWPTDKHKRPVVTTQSR